MRRWLGLVLIAVAVIGLLPFLPRAAALYRGYVGGGSADAFYSISNSSPLLSCSVNGPIKLSISKYNQALTGNLVNCASQYPASLTLTLSVATMSPNTGLSVSATTPTYTVQRTDSSVCRGISLSPSTAGTYDVVLKAETTGVAADGFYAAVYFPVQVQVVNGKGKNTITGTCP